MDTSLVWNDSLTLFIPIAFLPVLLKASQDGPKVGTKEGRVNVYKRPSSGVNWFKVYFQRLGLGRYARVIAKSIILTEGTKLSAVMPCGLPFIGACNH